MEFQLTTLEEIRQEDPIACLIYGPSRAGKTDFIGSAGNRLGIIDIGGGLMTLTSPGFVARRGKLDPKIIRIREKLNEHGFFEKAEAFDLIGDAMYYLVEKHGEEIDTIAVDEATALRKVAMYKALEANQELKRSQTLNKIKKLNALLVSPSDYQTEMSFTEQFLNQAIPFCKENNKHFILAAHERKEYRPPAQYGQEHMLVSIRPGFTGRTHPDAVTGLFDWVLYAEVVSGGVYRVRTRGDEIVVAGTRVDGAFPERITNPNFLTMVQQYREAKGVVKR